MAQKAGGGTAVDALVGRAALPGGRGDQGGGRRGRQDSTQGVYVGSNAWWVDRMPPVQEPVFEGCLEPRSCSYIVCASHRTTSSLVVLSGLRICACEELAPCLAPTEGSVLSRRNCGDGFIFSLPFRSPPQGSTGARELSDLAARLLATLLAELKNGRHVGRGNPSQGEAERVGAPSPDEARSAVARLAFQVDIACLFVLCTTVFITLSF